MTKHFERATASGNRIGLQCAINDLQQPLLRYTQTIVHDHDVARDIVQDAMMKLFKQSPPPADEQLKPWLFKVCRNSAIDHLRKAKRTSKSSLRDDAIVVEKNKGPAELTEQKDTFQTVMAEVATLSANQQEVLRLKFQSGFSYREISEVTGLTLSNVGVLLHKAISELKERLRD